MKAEIIVVLVVVAIVGVAAWFGLPTRHDMEGSVWNGSAQAFTYNGHEYLYFTANATNAIVHNPDCKCMKKRKTAMPEIKIDDAIFIVCLYYDKTNSVMDYRFEVMDFQDPLAAEMCLVEGVDKIIHIPQRSGELSKIYIRVPGGGNMRFGISQEAKRKRQKAVKKAKQKLLEDEIVQLNHQNNQVLDLMRNLKK